MRRSAVRVAANVGGLRITVMASRAGLFILSRRIQFVLVTVALVRMSVCGYDDINDRIGVHRRFGHRHHARLKRRHDQQDKRKRGAKRHHAHKSRLARNYHGISFDTCSGTKSSCAKFKWSVEIEM